MKAGVFFVVLALGAAAVAAQDGSASGLDAAELIRDFSSQLDRSFLEMHPSAPHNRALMSGFNATTFQGFLGDMFGKNWTDLVPSAWTKPTFDWPSLGDFDIANSWFEFMDPFNMTSRFNLTTVITMVKDFEAKFCSPWSFQHIKKIKPACWGPRVTLELVPQMCVIDVLTREIQCRPAQLVMVKDPAGCVFHGFTPAIWRDKTCALTKALGLDKEVIVGGKTFTIPLGKKHHAPAPGPAPGPAPTPSAGPTAPTAEPSI